MILKIFIFLTFINFACTKKPNQTSTTQVVKSAASKDQGKDNKKNSEAATDASSQEVAETKNMMDDYCNSIVLVKGKIDFVCAKIGRPTDKIPVILYPKASTTEPPLMFFISKDEKLNQPVIINPFFNNKNTKTEVSFTDASDKPIKDFYGRFNFFKLPVGESTELAFEFEIMSKDNQYEFAGVLYGDLLAKQKPEKFKYVSEAVVAKYSSDKASISSTTSKAADLDNLNVADIVEPKVLSYSYTGFKYQDLFVPPINAPSSKSSNKVDNLVIPITSELQRHSLASLVVSGIFKSNNEMKALILTPKQQGYTVGVGSPIGNQGGEVYMINEDNILVREVAFLPDANNTRTFIERTLVLVPFSRNPVEAKTIEINPKHHLVYPNEEELEKQAASANASENLPETPVSETPVNTTPVSTPAH